MKRFCKTARRDRKLARRKSHNIQNVHTKKIFPRFNTGLEVIGDLRGHCRVPESRATKPHICRHDFRYGVVWCRWLKWLILAFRGDERWWHVSENTFVNKHIVEHCEMSPIWLGNIRNFETYLFRIQIKSNQCGIRWERPDFYIYFFDSFIITGSNVSQFNWFATFSPWENPVREKTKTQWRPDYTISHRT